MLSQDFFANKALSSALLCVTIRASDSLKRALRLARGVDFEIQALLSRLWNKE